MIALFETICRTNNHIKLSDIILKGNRESVVKLFNSGLDERVSGIWRHRAEDFVSALVMSLIYLRDVKDLEYKDLDIDIINKSFDLLSLIKFVEKKIFQKV